MQAENRKIGMALLLSVTLGLAPFIPEPHLWGKIKWIMGGANGMQTMDYFDLLLHGGPWIYLSYLLIGKVARYKI
ncbi:MAG: hypothetical protein ACJA08_001099 [Cyclobacteriaceae bacterium]|jgi:hypothetical protein